MRTHAAQDRGSAQRGSVAGKQQRDGFTLMGLFAVMAMLGGLATILLVTLGPARKAAHVTPCTSNLRQIGVAYKIYLADYGLYPCPGMVITGPDLRGSHVLFCPEDSPDAPLGATSSYCFCDEMPPDFVSLKNIRDLDANTILVSCEHHVGQRTIDLKGDNTRLTPPERLFHLVLRGGGSAERIHLSRIKKFFVGKDRPLVRTVYPEEPRYNH
jgi:type II secretory pathway pseudopilin PulG